MDGDPATEELTVLADPLRVRQNRAYEVLRVVRELLLIVVLGMVIYGGYLAIGSLNAVGERLDGGTLLPDPAVTECVGEEPC